MRVHRQMKAPPAPFLQAIAPDRDGLVVAVECLFTWSWRAALGAPEDLPVVLGQARSMHARHGGTATHDTSDAPKHATLLRGGMLPKASVSPAAMRATREWLRRRTHLMRQRAALWAPVHQTKAPDHWPDIGKHIADQAKREGVAARFDDPAVHKTMEVDRELITSADPRRSDRARVISTTATPHDAHTLYG